MTVWLLDILVGAAGGVLAGLVMDRWHCCSTWGLAWQLPVGAFSPCVDATSAFASQPWCNATLPHAQRIADMIGRMSRAE